MIPYPEIDPVIFAIGPLKVRWYGLMYVLGFMAVHFLVLHQVKKYRLKFLEEHVENLNFALILGLILGARIGYMVFYNFSYYFQHPAEIIAIWQGGMSFHGAFAGLLIGGWFYCRKNKISFLKAADTYSVTVPIGLGLGRIGNFINGELYGRVTESPLGIIFPGGGPLPRHPSQLYEFFLEGVLLFILLWSIKGISYRRHWAPGTLFAVFLVGYGVFRSFAELFREPDAQLGFLWGQLTMGQLLSSVMIFVGIAMFVWNRRHQN